MTTLLLISVLITVLYVGTTIYIHKELPASVSHMVFNLPRNYQFLWTLFIWSVAFGTVPALLDAMEGSIFQFVGFLFIYCLEWLVKMWICWFDLDRAYRSISFEQEAYEHQEEIYYNDVRRHYAWLKYLFTIK